MRTWLALAAVVLAALPAHAQSPAVSPPPANPLLSEWKTPFGVPPFDQIKPEHYLPAFKTAIARHNGEVEAIAKNPKAPTFANTIEALEASGELLDKVNGVFGNLTSAETNDELQAIDREVSPLLAAHRDDILLNDGALPARQGGLGVAREAQARRRPGQAAREHLEAVRARRRPALEGTEGALPRHQRRARQPGGQVRRQRAQGDQRLPAGDRRPGRPGGAPRAGRGGRGRRRQGRPASRASGSSRCRRPASGRSCSTPTTASCAGRSSRPTSRAATTATSSTTRRPWRRIAALRAERAQLLGYKTHADFVLDENMAKTPDRVYGLLDQLWTPARAMAGKEAADLQAAIQADGKDFTLEPWDWRYYSEKVRKARFDLDEQALRPYFELEQRARGRVLRRQQALRHHLHAARRTCRSTTPR